MMKVNNKINFQIESFDNKLLLCNKCLSLPKIIINPYEHKISSLCPNDHEINSISLDLYLKEELNKSIICSKCNKNDKILNLLYCKDCLNILCQKCSNEHNSSHHIIKYDDINIKCSEHDKAKNKICLTCDMEICNECLERKHKNHKIQSMEEFLNLIDNNISPNLRKVLNENIKKQKKQIEIVNDMILKKINSVTQLKNAENQINQRILNNNIIYPNNYNSIYNINNMIKNNSASEESYYETISNLINILDNYLTNGNNGADKLILIKRKNLKNIFFLIVFLILVIIATYFFGDKTEDSIKGKVKDKDNINFNEDSNLLKLTEIIINEEQEKQMNLYLNKSISSIINQYNSIFNQNKNYNISLKYRLIYKGTRDGDNIHSFHKRCDNKNNLLFMIETQNNTKFGFFTFNGFTTKNIFLFKLLKDDKSINFYENINNEFILTWNPSTILEIKGKKNEIIYIPDKFFIENNFGRTSIKDNYMNVTDTFELNNGIEKFLVKDIEVFNIIFKNNITG